MSKRAFGKNVLCPYYKGEDASKIYCEGVEEGTSTHIAFGNREQLRRYRCDHCDKYKSHCLWADTLDKKYDYERD